MIYNFHYRFLQYQHKVIKYTNQISNNTEIKAILSEICQKSIIIILFAFVYRKLYD